MARGKVEVPRAVEDPLRSLHVLAGHLRDRLGARPKDDAWTTDPPETDSENEFIADELVVVEHGIRAASVALLRASRGVRKMREASLALTEDEEAQAMGLFRRSRAGGYSKMKAAEATVADLTVAGLSVSKDTIRRLAIREGEWHKTVSTTDLVRPTGRRSPKDAVVSVDADVLRTRSEREKRRARGK